jgi:DNA-binding response OmpR family regulator
MPNQSIEPKQRAHPQHALHILVVEDDQLLSHCLRISLQGAGYIVSTAGDGVEALAIFQDARIDLVLLDIWMPDMDGYTLCSELRKRSNVPIIIVSALSQAHEVLQGFRSGADAYVAKPFQFREVEARIHQLLPGSLLWPAVSS